MYVRSKKVRAPLLKTSKTADMEKKSDIPMAKENGEVIVNQSKSTPIEV